MRDSSGRVSDGLKRPASIQSFEDLEVFQRSLSLVRPVHELVKKFPPYEQADLGAQMRRASKSVPTNIAEGFSRRLTARDFKLFLAHALGSANEMVVHLMVARELGYCQTSAAESLIGEYRIVARQLARLTQVWRDPRERASLEGPPSTSRRTRPLPVTASSNHGPLSPSS